MGTAVQRRKPPGQRREDILAAALRLFHDRGVDGTTMQELASSAGVAAGTLYLYFPSKEHVLGGVHERFHDGLHARFVETAGPLFADGTPGDIGEMIDRLFDALVEYALDEREAYEVLARYIPRLDGIDGDRHDEGLVAAMGALIEEGVRRGIVQCSDPVITARLLYLAMREALASAITDGDEALARRIATQAKEVARKALALPT